MSTRDFERELAAAFKRIDELKEADIKLQISDERMHGILSEKLNAIKESFSDKLRTLENKHNDLEKEVIKRVTIATTIITILTIAIPIILKFF